MVYNSDRKQNKALINYPCAANYAVRSVYCFPLFVCVNRLALRWICSNEYGWTFGLTCYL